MTAKFGSGWTLILGHPVRKATIRLFVFVTALCVFGGAGLYYYFAHHPQQVTAAVVLPPSSVLVMEPALPQEAPVVKVPVLKVAPVVTFKNPLKALVARHIAVTGYDKMSSASVTGEYQVSGLTFDLVAMSRARQSYKQVFELNDARVEIGCVDHELWLVQTRPVFDIEESNFALVNRVFMHMELAIPFFGWQDPRELARADYDLLPDQEWQGRSMSVVRSRAFEQPILHFIDTESGLEVRRTATVTSKDTVEHFLEVLFEAPLEGMRFPFPSGYECRLDGELVSRAKFTEFEFNEWLPSMIFEPVTTNDD